jgi:hypothetical protein
MAKTNNVTKSKWLGDRLSLILYGAVSIVISYGLGSWAIDTGSFWLYLGCLVFLVVGIRLFIQALKNNHGNKAK